MIIFIDANKYLDLIRVYKNEDAKEIFSFLKEKQEEDIFTVIVTDQVINEFDRNKYAYKHQSVASYSLSLQNTPSYMQKSNSIKKIKKVNKQLKSLIKEAQEVYLSRLDKQINKVDKLLKKTKKVETREDIIRRADMRVLQGNPPEKTRSCIGDAISWEALLEEYSNEDLVIVSRDSDFTDKNLPIESNNVNPFLKNEWNKKGGKEVSLVHSFSDLMDLFSTDEERDQEETKSIRQSERALEDSSRVYYQPGTEVRIGNNLDNTIWRTATTSAPFSATADLSGFNTDITSTSNVDIGNVFRLNNSVAYAELPEVECFVCGKKLGFQKRNMFTLYSTSERYLCSECAERGF